MKTVTKICLILAAVFTILGFVGIFSGMLLGVRPSELKPVCYNNGFWYFGEALDDLGDDFGEAADEFMEDIRDIEAIEEPSNLNVDTFDTVYGSADIKKLKLELKKSTVNIYVWEEDSFRAAGSNAKKYLSIKEEGDTLIVQDHRGGRKKSLKLDLYVPERMLEEIELELGATEFYAQSLAAQDISIELGAGEVKIDSMEADETSVSLGAGKIDIEKLNAHEKAELDVGTGELTADGFEGRELSLNCGVGSICVTAGGSEDDYNYTLSCGIGNIDLNGVSYSGLGHETTIDNQADRNVFMDCGIGNIELAFKEAEEELKWKKD